MADARYPYDPQYEVRIDWRVRVRMRDGVELGAKITRPNVEGRFPALVEYNPYRRLTKPLPDYRDEYPPVVPYLAERGYVVVQYDVRGRATPADSARISTPTRSAACLGS